MHLEWRKNPDWGKTGEPRLLGEWVLDAPTEDC